MSGFESLTAQPQERIWGGKLTMRYREADFRSTTFCAVSDPFPPHPWAGLYAHTLKRLLIEIISSRLAPSELATDELSLVYSASHYVQPATSVRVSVPIQ